MGHLARRFLPWATTPCLVLVLVLGLLACASGPERPAPTRPSPWWEGVFVLDEAALAAEARSLPPEAQGVAKALWEGARARLEVGDGLLRLGPAGPPMPVEVRGPIRGDTNEAEEVELQIPHRPPLRLRRTATGFTFEGAPWRRPEAAGR